MSTTIFAVVGIMAGVFSSLLGVGGGIILIPAMTFMDVPFKVAVGTSLAIIVPTALMGAAKHYSFGNVNLQVGLIIALGAIIGANIGATIAEQLPALVIKRIFGVFMIVMSIRIMLGK